MEQLGSAIAEQRQSRGLSLRAAAQIAGLSHQAIFNAEQGKVGFEAALRIAKRLGVGSRRLVELAQLDARRLARAI